MNKLIKIVSVLVVAGMILTACASTATQTTVPSTQPATAQHRSGSIFLVGRSR